MMIIIGSGLAAYMFAKEWRKLDQVTPLTILTASRGDFYSKPLLSTALTQNKTAQELVITSAHDMANQLHAEIITEVNVEAIYPAEKRVIVSGKSLSYDRLVLACGSEPIALSLLGNASHEMFSVNDLESYARFRTWLSQDKQQLAILGTGLVGCEFANDLLNRGFEVDMISLESYPLARLIPEAIGRELQNAFAEKGVRWHFNVAAQTINRENARYHIALNNQHRVTADGVLSAVGLVANRKLAQNAGLKVNTGIVVNRYLQTSDPFIYALGDCAEVAGEVKHYVAPLLQCARTLAQVLVGKNEAVYYPPMPIVIKTSICPVVVCPVAADISGQWYYEGEGRHRRALFYDRDKQLRGFALCGDKVRDKVELTQRMASQGSKNMEV